MMELLGMVWVYHICQVRSGNLRCSPRRLLGGEAFKHPEVCLELAGAVDETLAIGREAEANRGVKIAAWAEFGRQWCDGFLRSGGNVQGKERQRVAVLANAVE